VTSDRAPIVELRGVTFTYESASGRATPFSLIEVSLDVERGEILGVIGPNSAGKTTLVRLLTGVVTPSAGEVRLEGQSVVRLASTEIARRIAVVPQALPSEFPFTVAELVLMGRYPHAPERFFESDEDRAIGEEAMAATGVLDLAGVPLERLSGGERQRAVIARALAQRPRLLILDEPMAHLDLRHQADTATLLSRLCRDHGMTIVLVSHDLTLASELSDRLLLLAEGRVVRIGSPEVVLDPRLLERAFGCPIIVERHDPTARPSVRVAWQRSRGQVDGRSEEVRRADIAE
jgi:iron complex transport system ATP-binding protein